MTPLLLSLALLAPAADPTPKAGVLPLGTDGKPLNLDFETGTLAHWTAEGEAFKGQPIRGDTVKARRADMASGHQGQFWLGGYEKLLDKPVGTLTSVPFKVTHPWGSFLVGGGPHPKETCVELIDVAAKAVFFTTPGTEEEQMRRVAVDLTKMVGKEIQIRIIDKHTGHWGHVNFDDFRFHSEKPDVPAPSVVLVADEYKHAGQPPADAAKNMTVPVGFQVDVIAAEPDLHQPIAFCWDDRGRLWVVEAFTYPKRHPEKGPIIPGGKLGDRILILEDTNGDGTFDKRTVFLEGLNLVSGIELGFGGVWIGAAPYLLYIPIDKTGDKPAGEPKILLDGWGYQDTHETLNSFIWGPDGWLYGCHGVFTHSNVGKPGIADKDRTRINAGIWRYHPTRHIFEVFAHGTSNPWGLDYNQHGDFFIEACVIPHLWHIVQGGRYERQAGSHFNPYTYDAQIKTIAKHRHYLGATPHSGNGKSDSVGGGHAHSGLMCYQGGVWPKEYHGKLFMGNLHGHRINVDEVKAKGASYEGDRNPDFLLSHDKHCIIVAIHAGPDGNVYFCDWSDKQVCHRNEVEIWDRTNGRLFRVSHKDAKPLKPFDLKKSSDTELVKLVTSDNEWMSRHARRILQERAIEKKVGADTMKALAEIATSHKDEAQQLRGLWALHAIGGLTTDVAKAVAVDTDPHVRAWLVQLWMETRTEPQELSPVFRRWAEAKDTPAVVTRNLLAASTRYPNIGHRLTLVKDISRGADMTADPVLPHLYWFAVEPLLPTYPHLLSEIGLTVKVPRLLESMTRRVAAIGTETATAEIVAAMGRTEDAAAQRALLDGFTTALKGTTGTKAPRNWSTAYLKLSKSSDPAIRQSALALGLKFGDFGAQKVFRDILVNGKADRAARLNALAVLVENKDGGLPALLDELLPELNDPELRGAGIRAVAVFGNSLPVSTLCRLYPTLTPAEKRDAIATLTSRPQFAERLLTEVEQKRIPPADIPAEALRQLRNFNDTSLSAKVAQVWGVVRDTPADRKKLITDYGKKLSPAVLAQADLGAGRAVYAKVCQQCHTLYGVGGKVGPEITGANRADLNYLLENIFDPSAVIPKEYAATKLDLDDGRVITGIIKEETATQLTVVTANETLTVSPGAIVKRTPSDLSMMPDDLTKQLSEKQLRDLFAYLKHPAQVPMLANKDLEKEFFNGKDLTGWDGDKDVWSVENGDIVGQTKTGLKRNNFLKSTMDVTDFKLSLKVKLTPNKENSGIQFRSVPIEGGEMRGPQADIGAGWWGKLYEESARGLLVKNDNEKLVKENDWNEYVIEAIGPKVRIWLNGEKVADYEDDKLAKRGVIAFQVHSGGPMEVRFKDIKLEVIEKK